MYFLFLITSLLWNSMSAQTINLGDSLRNVFKQHITPSFKFDTRNSFITGSTAKVYGIKAGVNFGKRLSIGLGYNFIGTELQEEVMYQGNRVRTDIRMNYLAPFIEYSFYQRGPWEVSTPIQIGAGSSFLRKSEVGGDVVLNKNRVVLYEPGMAVEYKIFKIIGVGVGFGYRIMLKNNRSIEQQFTSPVYALRMRLVFEEVYSRYKKFKETDSSATD